MSATSKKLMSIKNSALKDKYSQIGNVNDDDILLLSQPKETDSLFRELEIPSQKEFIDSKLETVRRIKAYENRFDNKEAFKGLFIKELCNKYHLQLQKLDKLKAYLSVEDVKLLKDTIEAEELRIMQSSFYILTNSEYFTSKYEGKQVKTFIIFYKDPSDTRSNYYIEEDSILIQLCSSGNDWKESRKLLKLIDTSSTSDNISMKNALIIYTVIFLCIGTIALYRDYMIIGTLLVLIWFIFLNFHYYMIQPDYYKHWTYKNN